MKKYGLLGFPLSHSFSKGYFTEKFETEKIDAGYQNFELPKAEQIIHELNNDTSIHGLNVTIPHKQSIMPLLDGISQEAQEIGAVNVVKVDHIGEDKFSLKGYNTDVHGFSESIKPLLQLHHKKALILGTGGASKAVFYGLKRIGIAPTYVSRKASEGILSYEQLSESIMKEHTVIVNATPLGTFPKDETCPDIPYHLITDQHLLFDLVYNPAETLFMKRGISQGAVVKNGLEMLHLQAEEAWTIWNR
ncbi:shikimate dehydrogenase [Halosquirtibacter laminarini]|uniref:Shikimate dehydrogenase n=1 Tax=Halosquirtibacter laminarini TaxID=3374600 RepID=A0AC61NP72_9BACT|nr:shikimate dehydrogenase [Prolixibacteraceae bacterium]